MDVGTIYIVWEKPESLVNMEAARAYGDLAFVVFNKYSLLFRYHSIVEFQAQTMSEASTLPIKIKCQRPGTRMRPHTLLPLLLFIFPSIVQKTCLRVHMST